MTIYVIQLMNVSEDYHHHYYKQIINLLQPKTQIIITIETNIEINPDIIRIADHITITEKDRKPGTTDVVYPMVISQI